MELTPEDVDYITRTVLGEADGQPRQGQAAVAAVILNRMRSGRYGGTTARDVVLAPGQFEPWQTRSRELRSYNPQADNFQRVMGIVQAVAGGTIPDPTNGTTHFMNTNTVYQRYGQLPAWGRGQGQKIGQHTFYAPYERVPPIAPQPDAPLFDPGAGDAPAAPQQSAEQARGQVAGEDPVVKAFGTPAAKLEEDPVLKAFGMPSPKAATGGVAASAPGVVAPPAATPGVISQTTGDDVVATVATVPGGSPITPPNPVVPGGGVRPAALSTRPGSEGTVPTGQIPQVPGPSQGDFRAPPPLKPFPDLPQTGEYAQPLGGPMSGPRPANDSANITDIPGIVGGVLKKNFVDPVVQAFKAPHDVYTGQLDPTSPQGEDAANTIAMLLMGGGPGFKGKGVARPLEGDILPPLPKDYPPGVGAPGEKPPLEGTVNPEAPPAEAPKALPAPDQAVAPAPVKDPVAEAFGVPANPLPETKPEPAAPGEPVSLVPAQKEGPGEAYDIRRGNTVVGTISATIEGDTVSFKPTAATGQKLTGADLRQARDQFLREHPEVTKIKGRTQTLKATPRAPPDKAAQQKEFIDRPHAVTPGMLAEFGHVRKANPQGMRGVQYASGQNISPVDQRPVPEWFPRVDSIVQDLAKKTGIRVELWTGEPKGSAGGIASNLGKSIILSSRVPAEQALQFAVHELGHQIDFQQYTYASDAMRASIASAYQRSMRGPAPGQTIRQLKPVSLEGAPYGDTPLASLPPQSLRYELGFSEWFAEQVSRFITQNKVPTTLAEKFFKGIADKWKQIYAKVVGHVPLTKEVDDFMRGVWRPDKVEPTPEAVATAPQPRPQAGPRPQPSAPQPNPAGLPPMPPPTAGPGGLGPPPAGAGGRAPPPPRPPRGPPGVPPTPRPQPGPRQPAPTPQQLNAVQRVAKAVQAIFSPQTLNPSAARSAASIRAEIGQAARDSAATAAELEPFQKMVNKLTPIEQFNLIDYIEGRSAGTPLFNPALQPVADALAKAFGDRMTKIQNTPSTAQAGFIQDYFPHLWKDAGAARKFMQGFGSKQGSGSNLKARKIPTLADGMAAGLEPVSSNPIEMAMRYVQNMDRYIAINTVWDKARASREIRYLQPKNAPPGWEKLNGRLAVRGPLQAYAPAGWALVWNNFISRGLHALGNGEFGEIFDMAQTASNNITAFELGLSGFHAATMVQETMVNEVARAIQELTQGRPGAAFASLAKGAIAPVSLAVKGAKLASAYVRPGSGSARMQQLADLLARAGGRAVGRGHAADYRFSQEHSYWTSFRRGALKAELKADVASFKAHPLTAPIRLALKHAGRIMETVAAPLFEKYIPAIKNGAFASNMQSWLEKHPAASQAEMDKAAMGIWDSIDNRFGEMVQDNIFWNKLMKQVATLTMRSFSWFLGTVREIGGGIADIPKSVKQTTKGEGFTQRTAYVLGLPIVFATLNAIYQMIKTGEPPKDMHDLLAGRTGGTLPATRYRPAIPERAMMPGYMKDVFGWYEDPYQEAMNKRSTATALLGETLSGKDWKGDPWHDRINNPGMLGLVEDWFKFASQSLGPISIRQAAKGEKPGSNISGPEQFLGLRPAPMYLADPAGYEGMKDAQARAAQIKQLFSQQTAAQAAGDIATVRAVATKIKQLKAEGKVAKGKEYNAYAKPDPIADAFGAQ